MKKVYSPQLDEVFTVVDENNSAYITEQGAYLSKKLAQGWEKIHYGWMLTPPEADMEELKKQYELDMFDKLFCRKLKDIDHFVNQEFYD